MISVDGVYGMGDVALQFHFLAFYGMGRWYFCYFIAVSPTILSSNGGRW